MSRNDPSAEFSLSLRRKMTQTWLYWPSAPDAIEILKDLNRSTRRPFHLIPNGTRVVVYTRFSREFIEYQDNIHRDYLVLNWLRLLDRREILLAAIHFPSKVWRPAGDQKSWACRISEEIRRAEAKAGHTRTVLVGDLNMNPFEDGMISADGFHAVMTVERARKETRTVGQKDYPFFYNPMWGLFGDNSQGPPGTYHRQGSGFVEYFWNVFDQVLIRPALLETFDASSVRILDRCESTSFLRSTGVPDGDGVSDHLPLLFSLRI
jgi:hypothetical protein